MGVGIFPPKVRKEKRKRNKAKKLLCSFKVIENVVHHNYLQHGREIESFLKKLKEKKDKTKKKAKKQRQKKEKLLCSFHGNN